ncbi:MAG: DUF3857 domain-containing protein [Elusimicrobiales bacterium]
MSKLLLILAVFAQAARADMLYLNDGSEISGTITGLDAASVSVNSGGKTQSYKRGDILKIQFVKEYSGAMSAPLEDGFIKGILAAPPRAADFPDDGYFTVLRQVRIDINPDKSYSYSARSVPYVLRERGKSPASFAALNYLPDIRHAAVSYGYSVTDSSVSFVNDISIMEGGAYVQYPAYSGARTLKFAVPNVQTGSLLDFEYRLDTQYVSTYPFFAAIPLRDYEPYGKTVVTVSVPEGLALAWKQLNMPENSAPSVTQSGGRTAYTWTLENTPSYKREPLSPPLMRIAPQLKLSLADTWENVRAALSPLAGRRMVVTPEIAAKTEELVSGKKTALEKAETLYNWVAREIKYQPVPVADYSYIPKPSDEIFSRKAGNALDKPFMLYVMLYAAGLNPQFAYMCGKDAVFEPSLPNIRQFDAAAVLLDTDSGRLLLAPQDDVRRYNEIPPQLQGASGLLVLGGGTEEPLFSVPLSAPEMESEETSASLALDRDGGLSGLFAERMTGQLQAAMRSMKNLKKEDLDKAAEAFAQSLHSNARLESYRMENLDDLSKNLAFSMKTAIKNYALRAGKYLLLKFPGVKYSAANESQTERELPFFWHTVSRQANVIRLKLPAGYRVYNLPGAVSFAAAGQKYSGACRVDGNEIVFSDELRRERNEIPPAEYPAYKAFREAVAGFSEEWLVLEAQ